MPSLPDPHSQTDKQKAQTIRRISEYLNSLSCDYHRDPFWEHTSAANVEVIRLLVAFRNTFGESGF